MRPARARYWKRYYSAISVYVVALFSVSWIFRHHHLTGAAAFLLALLPALPIVGVVIIVALYMREETDEVEMAVLTQSMVWGIGLTLTLATLWGFLEAFGQVPHVNGYWAFWRSGSTSRGRA
jgi:cytochrome bd-type quinol oxidase subunit 2